MEETHTCTRQPYFLLDCAVLSRMYQIWSSLCVPQTAWLAVKSVSVDARPLRFICCFTNLHQAHTPSGLWKRKAVEKSRKTLTCSNWAGKEITNIPDRKVTERLSRKILGVGFFFFFFFFLFLCFSVTDAAKSKGYQTGECKVDASTSRPRYVV